MRNKKKMLIAVLCIITMLVTIAFAQIIFWRTLPSKVIILPSGLEVYDVDGVTPLTSLNFGSFDTSATGNTKIAIPNGYPVNTYFLKNLGSADYNITYKIATENYTQDPAGGWHIDLNHARLWVWIEYFDVESIPLPNSGVRLNASSTLPIGFYIAWSCNGQPNPNEYMEEWTLQIEAENIP